MATLKSMKLTAEEAKGEYSCCPTSEGDAPKYPYGLNLCLGDEALAKLGMGLMPVGTEIMVMAQALAGVMPSCSRMAPGVSPSWPATTRARKTRKRTSCAKAASERTTSVSVMRK